MFDQIADLESYENKIEIAIDSKGYEVVDVTIDNHPETIDINEIKGRAIVKINCDDRCFHFTLTNTAKTIINE